MHYSIHHEPDADEVLIDQGLGAHNDAAAPLHEVRHLSCLVHDEAGRLLGGAIGRRWGDCAELMQLWVDPAQRGRGLGAGLVRGFEAAAVTQGCRHFFLETFSFQAPGLYRSLGYVEVHVRRHYPHGIVKHFMEKSVVAAEAR